MNDIPILFNAEMVRAILARTKTHHRLPLKSQPPNGATEVRVEVAYGERVVTYRAFPAGGSARHAICACPFGAPGDTLFWTMKAPSWAGQTPKERFWARVHKTNTCWEWLGHVSGHAKHGVIKIGQRSVRTHRYSWEIHHGDPGDMRVLHTCDVGWCVNPDHLYLGTDQNNRRDQEERGRIRHLYGGDNPASKITNQQAEEVRAAYIQGAMQQDLADQYGIHQSQVSRIVNDRRRVGETTPPLPLLGSRWLPVKRVWVERVQDISWSDIIAEGVPDVSPPTGQAMLDEFTGGCDAETAFRDYWDSIYAAKNLGWDDNPLVAACEFELIEQKARKS